MDDAATAGPTPLHRGLPDEIAIWEILVRLPPKCLLRCRAVCRAWRRATTTRSFLLAHHGRQPTLPILFVEAGVSAGIIPFDHRAGLTATYQLQSIARLRRYYVAGLTRKASCDGLLVISLSDRKFTICNPVTRQYVPLPQLDRFSLLGMYRNGPTSEYRLLLRPGELMIYGVWPEGMEDGFYVFTLGSGQPPRHIGNHGMEELELAYAPMSVPFRGNLHWHLEQQQQDEGGASNRVWVFDTTAESFRPMRAPVVPGHGDLIEMGDKLGMFSSNDANTIVNIWVMQDYEGEVWALKHRVELPVAEIRARFQKFKNLYNPVVAASWDGDFLVLVRLNHWLLHVDVHGKLVASFRHRNLYPPQVRLKQTLVPHTFLPALEDCVVNASPFHRNGVE